MTGGVWFVSVERPGWRAEWDCATLGAPEPRDLLPTRRPTSGDFSRHIPRRAYAVTTGNTLELESGLEHDLVRWLDGCPNVVWLVGQPLLFHLVIAGRCRALLHTPDLLSLHEDGSVIVWDARPRVRQDDAFRLKAELTAEECRKVGWRHQVFEGLPTPTRMNLLWLNGYRRPAPWQARWVAALESLLKPGPRSVGDLRARDDGSGELIATMWHLIAIGKIECDLARPIRDRSVLSWRAGKSTPRDDGAGDPVAASPVLDAARSDVLLSTRLRRAAR